MTSLLVLVASLRNLMIFIAFCEWSDASVTLCTFLQTALPVEWQLPFCKGVNTYWIIENITLKCTGNWSTVSSYLQSRVVTVRDTRWERWRFIPATVSESVWGTIQPSVKSEICNGLLAWEQDDLGMNETTSIFSYVFVSRGVIKQKKRRMKWSCRCLSTLLSKFVA